MEAAPTENPPTLPEPKPRVSGSNTAPPPTVYAPGERERIDAEWSARWKLLDDFFIP